MNASKQFEAQGYTILPKFFEPEEINQITHIVDRIFNQWQEENHHALIEQQLINMHSLTHPNYFEECRHERIQFFNLIASAKLTRALEQIFKVDMYFHNTQLFFNPYSKEKQPYWHRDLQYSPIDDAVQAAEQHNMLSLHVRIPLVAEKGVELIPDSHTRWDTELERNVRFELNDHRQNEALPGSVLIELEPGDALIFSAQIIHRGNYALNPGRKALDLCLGKPHPLVESFLDPIGLPNDEEMKYICDRTWYDLSRKLIPDHN
ncbi:phytanoyl-CoA dioxygenase family protein [Leptothoe spongobia]|uniref:Phytanoyl-CoA dioxygenase family protein n=1 Tax=Leptothoe spongobia TAU-MAC 1115 TaxID=1967444 RepID=A0A947DJZ8_9CYAN|nr:phytanoyl-CoA dioxygenase family protein [Leptothoe spongobia]MBT9317655.1 phytanoyl-CoA dioxygenase family protein [Leptothoe spongobia TAU-MAC 1115]